MKVAERLKAFKNKTWPYGQEEPVKMTPQQRALLQFHKMNTDAYRLTQASLLLVDVYGPVVGPPSLVKVVNDARAAVKRGVKPKDALESAMARYNVSLKRVLRCLKRMKGAF